MDIPPYIPPHHPSPRGWTWDLVTFEPKKVKSLVWLGCECMCLNIIDTPWRLATMSYVSNKFTPTMSGMVCVSSHPTTSFITQRMDMRYDDYVASNEVKKIGMSILWLNIEDGLEIWWFLSLNKGQELDMAGVWVYVLKYYRCSMKIGNYVIYIQQVYTSHEWYGLCLRPTTSFITQRMDIRYDNYVVLNEVKVIGISTVWRNVL